MRGNKKINVLYDGKIVGTMAATVGRKTAFEYSDECIGIADEIKEVVTHMLGEYLRR